MAIKSRMPSAGSIEKAIEQLSGGLNIEGGQGADIQMPGAQNPNINELEDGSVEIIEDGAQQIDQQNIPFDANLADYIEEEQLRKLSDDCVGAYESDKDSRKDWEDTYVKGLDMLGFKYEDRTQPFEGASSVINQLLAESVT